jgi:quinol monooxygenase YgiN
MWLVLAGGRFFVIIVRITMNALMEKRTEVMQTLISMIEPTENARGCLSFHVLRDIEGKSDFSLIEEWETRADLDDHIKSDRFSVLLGTKSLLCEPMKIQIFTVTDSEGIEAVNSVRKNETASIHFNAGRSFRP